MAEIKEVAISEIKPPLLSKTYSLKRLTLSLQEYGQQRPVVLSSDMYAVAGWGIVQAARKLGWDSVACEVSEHPYDKLQSYRIADNKCGESAAWNGEILASQIEDILDGDGSYTGFSDSELMDILYPDRPQESSSRLTKPDKDIVLKYNQDDARVVIEWLSGLGDDWASGLWEYMIGDA